MGVDDVIRAQRALWRDAQGITGACDLQPYLAGDIWEDFPEKNALKLNKNEKDE